MSPAKTSLQPVARAPLLWVLIPWMTGYWLADRFDEIDPIAFGGMALAGTVLSLTFTRFPWWSMAFFVGATGAGSWYYSALEGPFRAKEPFTAMPVRELELTFEVTRVFDREDPFARISGIAEIRETHAVRQDLLGKRVYFFLRNKFEELLPVISTGAHVRARGLLTPCARQADKGFEKYLWDAGVSYRFDRGVVLEMSKPPNWFGRFCRASNEKLEMILRHGGTESSPLAAVGVAMTLGKKSALSDEQKDRYVATGVMHLFAISGLHVGVVASVLAFILRWSPGPKWLEALSGLAFLFIYVEITGGNPSARRAFLMVAFWWGTRLLGRPGSSLPALTASALAALLLEPRELWNLGFQLSYCVVVAIVLYGVPLASRLQTAWQPWAYLSPQDHSALQRCSLLVWKWFSGAFCVSFAATLASAPLIMVHFGVFTPGAILLNVFLVLFAGLAIICGFASIVCGVISLNFLSAVINHGQWTLFSLMDGLVVFFNAIPVLFLRVEVTSISMASAVLLITMTIFMVLVNRISTSASWICLLPLLPLCLLFFFATKILAQ